VAVLALRLVAQVLAVVFKMSSVTSLAAVVAVVFPRDSRTCLAVADSGLSQVLT
jgi:hypothetical protein